MAYDRGWDTEYNGGGIWEQQPDMTPSGEDITKAALSNNSLGLTACLIYKSTLDRSYLTRAIQIYKWMRHHLYNANTGQVYTGIYRDNTVDIAASVYNQGSFVHYATQLYEITGKDNYFKDAERTINYVKNHESVNGVVSDPSTFGKTWADGLSRGFGQFVRDNRLCKTYYPWMTLNANAIWDNRRTDYNITWNSWAKPTPNSSKRITTQYASAVAWMLYTPRTIPDGDIAGIHYIVNKKSGMAIDNDSSDKNGAGLILQEFNHDASQKWLFSQNADDSWNIISMSSWFALADPAGNNYNGTQMVQQKPNRKNSQRWWIVKQSDGSYRIWNKASSGALDVSNSDVDVNTLIQRDWNGGDQQRWLLK
jgi:hypothetical protein